MNLQIILQSLLTLHIIGLIILAGTTFINYVVFKSFWKVYHQEKERSTSLFQLLSKFPKLIAIGGALIIATGIGMMAFTHGVFGEQLWFRIKFGLIIILIVNGLLVGRRQGLSLQKIMDNRSRDLAPDISRIKVHIKRFHLIQLAIFFTIILLSVFKFT